MPDGIRPAGPGFAATWNCRSLSVIEHARHIVVFVLDTDSDGKADRPKISATGFNASRGLLWRGHDSGGGLAARK